MSKSTSLFLALSAAVLGTSSSLAAEVDVESGVVDDARQDAVLRGLRPRVEVAGRAPVRWTLEERMAKHAVPAVSIAVIADGRIAWTRAIGVREAGAEGDVSPETLFQAGSVSKPVTATAVLRFVDQGRLDLDADIDGLLATWRPPSNEFTKIEKVTPRRLLSHTAGVTVHGFRGYARGEPVPTLVQVLDGAGPANNPPIEVDAVPGGALRYSGGGYTILQQLLVDVAEEPFEALLDRLVLVPSGMVRSTYAQPLPASLHGDAARGHDATGAPIPGGWHTMPEQAAAGLWTTAGDLARWAIAVADAYTGRSSALLSRDVAKEMLTPQRDGAGLGLPLSGNGDRLSFSHSGANVGFRAIVVMFPERGAGIAVMSNSSSGGAVADEVIRAVAAEYGWPDFAPVVVTEVELDAERATGIAGKYTLRIGPGRPVEVRYESGRLTMYGPQDMVQELLPESDTRFINPENGWRFEFVRDASGRATSVTVYPGGSGSPVQGARAE